MMTNQEIKHLNFLLSNKGSYLVSEPQKDYIIDDYSEEEYYDDDLRGFETFENMYCIIDKNWLHVYDNDVDFYLDWQLAVEQRKEELEKTLQRCQN